jgi:hypothetical protein
MLGTFITWLYGRSDTRIGGFSRTPFIVFNVIFGVMAIISVGASLYALLSTPQVQEIPILVDGRLVRTESKLRYLFGPSVFHVALFWISLQFVRMWEFFADLMDNPPEIFRHFPNYMSMEGQQRYFVVMFSLVLSIFCIASAFLLITVLRNCANVLQMN